MVVRIEGAEPPLLVVCKQQNYSYILVFKNFLLRLVLDLWSLNVVSVDSQLGPVHGQRVQALRRKTRDRNQFPPCFTNHKGRMNEQILH